MSEITGKIGNVIQRTTIKGKMDCTQTKQFHKKKKKKKKNQIRSDQTAPLIYDFLLVVK